MSISVETQNKVDLANAINKINQGSIAKQGIRAIGTLVTAPFRYEEQKKLDSEAKLKAERDEQRAYEREQLEDARSYNDSLYSRRISDMRKAGINPNLFNNVQGDSISVNSSDNNIMLENLRSMLEEELKGEELSNETFNKIVGVVGTILGASIFKGKI